jgi:hypothetical protein
MHGVLQLDIHSLPAVHTEFVFASNLCVIFSEKVYVVLACFALSLRWKYRVILYLKA